MDSSPWLDYYAILELYDPINKTGKGPKASPEEITEAWQLQLSAWQPDKFDGNARARAAERTRQINAAKEVLRIPENKQAYDAVWLDRNPWFLEQVGANSHEIIGQATDGVDTGASTEAPPAATGETLYCVNHPTVETLLRCNRCGRPICLKCAELTDVGYRCKECIRGVQDKYFTALPTDNLIALGVAMIVTAIVAPVLGLVLRMFWLFGWILAFMLGGAAGGILVQIIRTAVGKRRGRHTRYYALAGVILGVIAGGLLGSGILGIPLSALLFNIPLLIFAFLVAATTNQLLR